MKQNVWLSGFEDATAGFKFVSKPIPYIRSRYIFWYRYRFT
ncbi:hypothetical protein [Marixanthomonas sp. SCSIO 43207]|nr:hypothetical protein [Marixanthomonas sp. SCSIO 43207]